MRTLYILPLALALAACATPPVAKPSGRLEPAPSSATSPAGVPADWDAVVTAADRDRIDRATAAWTQGLAAARKGHFEATIDAEGPLLDPQAALVRPTPPPGQYQCRVIKLGAPPPAKPFASFPPYFCFVDADGPLTILVKETGSERPAGRLWDGGETRLLFLGTMVRGGEKTPLAYATDAKRDIAGIFDRVAPFRWRLAMPWPIGGEAVDVIEMVPITQAQPAG